MRNIRLTVSYDGSNFCGWQQQPGQPSVEAALTAAVSTMNKTATKIYAAGRTDSGVDAYGQVVNFYSPLALPAQRFAVALNALLPPTVRVLESEEVAQGFHSRYDAVCRVYRYRILNQPHVDVNFYQKSWYVRQPLCLNRLNACLRPILGEHDFTTFAAAGSQAVHNIRRIAAANFYPEGPCLVLNISGNAFLWHMVRSLVGTCITLVKKGEQQQMAAILAAKDRRLAGPTAPARALTLHRVCYQGGFDA